MKGSGFGQRKQEAQPGFCNVSQEESEIDHGLEATGYATETVRAS